MFNYFSPELLWFFLGLILLLGELVIPAFVVIFFGVGAWATSVAIVIGLAPNIDIQLIIFMVVSVITLALFRNSGKRLAKGNVSAKVHDLASIDASFGNLGKVTEEIAAPDLMGKVEFGGTSWRAISETPINKGEQVEVTGRDNLTLKVKPLKRN